LSLSVNQGGGFVRTRPDLERPNIQLYFSPVSYLKAPPGTRPLMSPDPYSAFLLGISHCRPTSRGHLQIRSPDPFAPPAIHPNYLSAPEDLSEMLDGVRFLRRLATTPAMAALIEAELRPGAAVRSDDALIDDIRQRAGTVFHPTSTCMMGPDPSSAVVDPRLHVHGLAALRVIDASIFPCVPSGNTNAPTIMVGEKGADLVLHERGP
jgi:choline dehydrogenase